MSVEDVERCSVCGAHATRYVGKTGVIPICDLPSCFESRVEEINKLIKEMNKEAEVHHEGHQLP